MAKGQVVPAGAASAFTLEDGQDPGVQLNASSLAFADPIDHPSHLVDAYARIAFTSNLSFGQQLQFGVQDPTGNKSWIPVFDPILQAYSEGWREVGRNGTWRIFTTDPDLPAVDAGSFVSQPVAGYRVSSNAGVFHSTPPLPEERASLKGLDAPGLEPVASKRLNGIPIGLTGFQTIRFFNEGGGDVRIQIRDVNRATGSDLGTILLERLDGGVLQNRTIEDDGDVKNDKAMSTREFRLALAPSGGWYQLEIRDFASDLRVENLLLPGPVEWPGSLNLGGAGQGTHQVLPFEVSLRTSGGNLSAQATADLGRQNLTIAGDDGSVRVLNLNQTKVKLSTPLAAGLYRITVQAGSLGLAAPNGIFSFQDGPLPIPHEEFVDANATHVTLHEALRGNHNFWTYVDNGQLDLRLTKEDLNKANNDDNMTIQVRDLQGHVLNKTVIPDDGDLTNDTLVGEVQEATIHVGNLSAGSYRIAMQGTGDYRLREVSVNQPKLVAESVFLVGVNRCCFKVAPLDNQIDVWYESIRPGNLTALTSHSQGLQTLDVVPQGQSKPSASLVLNKTNVKTNLTLDARAPIRIHVPQQDVQLSAPGYFSFTPESFFMPMRDQVVAWNNDPAKLAPLVDYVALDFKDYDPAPHFDTSRPYDWHHTWKPVDLGVQDGTLHYFLQITGYNKKGNENRTVVVQDLTITMTFHPDWEKNSFLRWLHRTFR